MNLAAATYPVPMLFAWRADILGPWSLYATLVVWAALIAVLVGHHLATAAPWTDGYEGPDGHQG